jgi:hypothetical protein
VGLVSLVFVALAPWLLSLDPSQGAFHYQYFAGGVGVITAQIAGHHFEAGRCRCGILWTNIRNATEADLEQEGIAHIGKLIVAELSSIQRFREAEDDAIRQAFGWRN